MCLIGHKSIFVFASRSKDQEQASVRELLKYPDFMIIGAQKAATTTFHSLLVDASQGQICGYGDKEKHFFSGPGYEHDYEAAVAKYKSQFSGCGANQLTNDATPGYSAKPNTPQKIKESYSPEDFAKKKFIFLLREPVHRLYSEFQMACRVCEDTDVLMRKSDQEYKVGKTRLDRWIMQVAQLDANRSC